MSFKVCQKCSKFTDRTSKYRAVATKFSSTALMLLFCSWPLSSAYSENIEAGPGICRSVDQETVDFFTTNLRSDHGCSEIESCDQGIKKRVAEYTLFIGSPALEVVDEQKTAAVNSLFSNIHELIPIPVLPGRFRNYNFFQINFVNEVEAKHDIGKFIEQQVAPPGILEAELRARTFRDWLGGALICTGIATDYEDHIVRDIQIFVRNDADLEETKGCLRRQTLKLMGVRRLAQEGSYNT